MKNLTMIQKAIISAIENSQSVKNANAKIKLHLKGEFASNLDEEMFIKNTNQKYFGLDSKELLDDFVEISNITQRGKENFIRIQLSNLKEMTEGEINDYIDEQIAYAKSISKASETVLDSINSYDSIKDKLIIRPLNLTRNKKELESYCIYDTIGDIALVLYTIVSDTGHCLNTIKIPSDVFDKWGLSKAIVMANAMANTRRLNEPRIYTNLLAIEETLRKDSAFMDSDCTLTSLNRGTIPLVTTDKKTNGAIAIFYPGVKEKIAELYGSEYYIAFTSVHEAMLHKKDTLDPQDIRRHVRATNNTFGPIDTLSDNVFYFDGNSLTVVED